MHFFPLYNIITLVINMKTIGLVAEYNPFHNGHLYQINKIKELYPDSTIIVVMSPTITQRGELSLINKWNKTKICLDNNIDIVVELPSIFAMQSADIFAKGAITILNKLNINILVFGTEEKDLSKLKEVANLQKKDTFHKEVKKYLDTGYNYPTSLSKVIKNTLGYTITSPNDLLAVSYLKYLNSNITPFNIQRTTSYNGTDIKDNITSATNLRTMLKKNIPIHTFIPNYNQNNINKIDDQTIYNYLKYNIITNSNSLNKYVDVTEGLENRIIKYIQTSQTKDELITNIKTKRYTYNRISRMLSHILLSLTKDMTNNINVDYIRILGFTLQGQKHIKTLKKNIDIPLITGYKKNTSKILDYELKISSIYSLITNDNILLQEYNKKPIIKK